MTRKENLYHGTTIENARRLLRKGWRPSRVRRHGVNNGDPRYLYLSTDPNDARFYGYMNDEYSSVTLKVRDVPLSALRIDPEDTSWFAQLSVEQALAHPVKFPRRLMLTEPISAKHFSIVRSAW